MIDKPKETKMQGKKGNQNTREKRSQMKVKASRLRIAGWAESP